MRAPSKNAFKLGLALIAVSMLTAATTSEAATLCEAGTGPSLPNPILFITQFPIAADFATIGSTFANHRATISRVGRGGDLFLRYPDGTLCNLTREAGFGTAGEFQGTSSIAVRDPSVHWDGTRALFSMVIGAPSQRYQQGTYRWQIYEVTGLAQGQPAVITKIASQPEDYNNITPIYVPGGRILFTSDRPRSGAPHLYPQLDEYESTPTNTGLWSLDPSTGELEILDHAPSGAFTPLLDSFGRVIFSRWDHLQRDQQADADAGGGSNGTFNYADETAGATRYHHRDEVFPEPRADRTDLLAGTNMNGLRFNHFFPWQIHPDGTELETLNHIGRHELHSYFNRALNDDPSLVEFIDDVSGRTNPNPIENFFQIEEDPTNAGVYIGVEAPEFGTHASGQIISMTGAPSINADQMTVSYLTHPATGSSTYGSGPPPPEHSGHYRDPLPLTDGSVIVAHTFETREADNEGTRQFPDPRYDFRLRVLTFDAGLGYFEAGAALTAGLSRRVWYWDPDQPVTYEGPFWEMSPVEVRVRPEPPPRTVVLEAAEAQAFADAGVDVAAFRADLERRGLALVVSRDVTTRDDADRQQPFNLKVAGSSTQTLGDAGKIYEVSHLQFFQGDLIRGDGGADSPSPGRRVLAQPLHYFEARNPPAPGAPPGSVTLGSDGSMAALVPARRALSWQLTDPTGTPVVRERYWLTFQPGEIRVCASCHGLNEVDQANGTPPDQQPEALGTLLEYWKKSIFSDGFASGDVTEWTTSLGAGN